LTFLETEQINKGLFGSLVQNPINPIHLTLYDRIHLRCAGIQQRIQGIYLVQFPVDQHIQGIHLVQFQVEQGIQRIYLVQFLVHQGIQRLGLFIDQIYFFLQVLFQIFTRGNSYKKQEHKQGFQDVLHLFVFDFYVLQSLSRPNNHRDFIEKIPYIITSLGDPVFRQTELCL